jgi:hypothetical protein
MDVTWMAASTENFKAVTRHILEQSFCDLGTATVPGADKKNFLFFIHGLKWGKNSIICNNSFS